MCLNSLKFILLWSQLKSVLFNMRNPISPTACEAQLSIIGEQSTVAPPPPEDVESSSVKSWKTQSGGYKESKTAYDVADSD